VLRCWCAEVHSSHHPSSFPQRPWRQSYPEGVQIARTARSANFAWIVSHSRRKHAEYKIILGKYNYIPAERGGLWKKLFNNYAQAKGMLRMEGRLIKTGTMETFNQQFQDNVNREVFRRPSKEELMTYKGPFHFITMVEAYETGPYATTPLRICMNSCMKAPALRCQPQ
jgi:hypothetical protein